jgi:predicted RNA binding protein YcfA (HicA-like mRNA interferase family)
LGSGPRLVPVPARVVLRVLRKLGYRHVGGRGSHQVWESPDGSRRTTVPVHPGHDLPRGTLHAILTDLGLDAEAFNALR